MSSPRGMGSALLEPGTLWQRIRDQTVQAERTGALVSIPTESELVEDGGVDFLVRVVGNLARKEAQRRALAGSFPERTNPFLPYEAAMHVADLTDTHVCLLNKYNVVPHHILIVTRAFEEQERLLTVADFEAMWISLLEIDGLAFYNGGVKAGASQAHKHLQQVPLPLGERGPAVPIAPLLATCGAELGSVPGLPFLHALARAAATGSARRRAEASLAQYQACFKVVGLELGAGATHQPAPYNLLATREWMLLVPRANEHFAGCSLNALAFAGALLVRNREQLAQLATAGPMAALAHAGVPTARG